MAWQHKTQKAVCVLNSFSTVIPPRNIKKTRDFLMFSEGAILFFVYWSFCLITHSLLEQKIKCFLFRYCLYCFVSKSLVYLVKHYFKFVYFQLNHGKGVIPPPLFQINPPFLRFPSPFLEIQDVLTFHRFIRKTRVLKITLVTIIGM